MKKLIAVRRIITLLVSCVFLLLFSTWILITSAGANEKASSHTLTGAVMVGIQDTPTADPKRAALEKEKLVQEINQLKNQSAWAWTNLVAPFTFLVGIVTAIFGSIGWLRDRRTERNKRSEERFQFVVTNLGNREIEARINAAIMLRTFLRSDYEQFHRQVFRPCCRSVTTATTRSNYGQSNYSHSTRLTQTGAHRCV